ncbi:MAG: Si-specific NAD(P)(+) transhydrogenase [Planctomycetaceae bacterium]
MIAASNHYDVVVIGSGPAGQNAAVEAGRRGARVLIIEREKRVGGACVQYGTIPSKTLRETAVTLTAFRRRSGNVYNISQDCHLSIASLMTRLEQVVNAHQDATECCLEMAGVERAYGRGSFVAADEVKIESVDGRSWAVLADKVVIATGSRPRTASHIAVDHENILDSDSILSMTYLPQSIAVLGSGVIACEYASTFAALGVKVVMIDKWPAPLGFLDADLVAVFLSRFQANGGRFRGGCGVRSVVWDGVSQVEVSLDSGEVIRADKALAAMGRIANLDSLQIENAGLRANDRELLDVNEFCQTSVPNIYAVGDAIGPPALASTSMEQGRRAVCHALNESHCATADLIPTGIYTIPEMAMIGLSEKQAIERHGAAIVGTVPFDRLARAHIMASDGGLLKLVADGAGRQLLGIQIAGDTASELIHPGQLAMLGNIPIDAFAGTIFNFPTMAEAYRLAALEILHRRPATAGFRPVQATCHA